jgi:hypothetical protein
MNLNVCFIFFRGVDITDPIFKVKEWPAGSFLSKLLNFLLFAANLVSYALDSIPLVRASQRTFYPNFADDWNLKCVLEYVLISLPSMLLRFSTQIILVYLYSLILSFCIAFILGLILALIVPNLFIMLSIVTALTIPWVCQIYPALCYILYRRKHMAIRYTTEDISADITVLLINEAASDRTHVQEPAIEPSIANGSEPTVSYSVASSGSMALISPDKICGVDGIYLAYPVLFIGILSFLCCATAAYGQITLS